MKWRKAIAALLTGALLCALAVVPAAAYSDTEGHAAQELIDKWSAYGVVQGDGSDAFRPDAAATRADLAQMLAKTLGLTERAENACTDLTGGEWYADAVLKCVAAGILTVEDGKCDAEAPLTGEEAVLMLRAAFASEGLADGGEAVLTRAETLELLDKAATAAGKLPQAPQTTAENPKPLVLQGAMGIETSTMAEALTEMREVTIGNWTYFTGLLDGYPVVVSRTQVGVSNCAVATAYAIEHFDPIAVINQGTAGGHDPELHTHDIVIGVRAINLSGYKSKYAAEGEGIDTAKWAPLGMEVYNSDEEAWEETVTTAWFPDEALLTAARSVTDTYTAGKVVEGTIGSGDAWNNQVDRMLQCHELLGNSCEEMETATAAQLCDIYDVPFLGVRILSNTGIYKEETFNPATGPECQEFVLDVARAYIATLPKAENAQPARPKAVTAAEGKPVVIQGAMTIETSTMAEALTDMREISIGPWDYFAGELNGYPVVISRTEQGMANCAAATAFAIEHFDPIAVINQGTSGGHDPALHTMDIVLGENVINMSRYKSEYAAEGEGIDTAKWHLNPPELYNAAKGEWADVDFNSFTPDAALLAAAERVAETYQDGKVVKGTIGTGDIWNNEVDRILQCHELYGTSAEEMETAAAAQVCYNSGVPFLGVRILSNTGIYKDETFNPASGVACQNFVLDVAEAYIATLTADQAA